jgi:hypothetical protein
MLLLSKILISSHTFHSSALQRSTRKQARLNHNFTQYEYIYDGKFFSANAKTALATEV